MSGSVVFQIGKEHKKFHFEKLKEVYVILDELIEKHWPTIPEMTEVTLTSNVSVEQSEAA